MNDQHFHQLVPLHHQTIPTSLLAHVLQVSSRQVRRLRRSHGYRPRIPWNRIPDEVREYVTGLKREQPQLNCQWISELVTDRFEQPISRSSVWRILDDAHLLTAERAVPIVRKRFEAEQTGDIVQLDTSVGFWLNGERICLILLLDDYSRYILAAEFFWVDSAYNNMRMIRNVIVDYGCFRLLYTDNASFFKAIRHDRSIYQRHRQSEYESQITRACQEVGVTHVTHQPYQPQGKGKIERLFRFIQERLVSQFERQGIRDLEAANLALTEWVDWYNLKHINRTTGMTPKKRFDPQGFTPLSGKTNLDDIFCVKDTRKVDKCNQFSYAGTLYTIPRDYCLTACRIALHIHPHHSIRVWHNGTYICELPMPFPS